MDAAVLSAAQTLWDYHCIDDPLRKADVIVGLGSYDLRVVERCAALHAARWAPLIVFTGNAGNWTRGLYNGSEAAAFADHAIKHGVPRSAIVLEEQASNIGENIALTRQMMPAVNTAIFVTKPQTQRRVVATLPVQWPGLDAMVTAPEHCLMDQPTRYHPLEALVSEMVGDIWRMQTYPAKGYQIGQDIPADVLAAFDTLATAGFTAHLPKDARPSR